MDLCLPILDKVVRKTLYLMDYTLSPGHCQGLAAACQLLNHKVVNRLVFDNCGIDDSELAMILNGFKHVRDFKSLIYKDNDIGD